MSTQATYTNPPSICDICGAPIRRAPKSVFYDAKTRGGRWGNLCPSCFTAHGVGLGTGLGQEWSYSPTQSAFVKTAG